MTNLFRSAIVKKPASRELLQPLKSLLLSALAVLLATSAHAQSANWTGALSDDWGSGGNWSTGAVPSAGVVTINTTASNPVVASGITFEGSTLNIGSAAGSSGRLDLVGGSQFQTSGGVNVGSTDTAVGHLVVSGEGTSLEVRDTSHLSIGHNTGAFGQLDILDGASVTAGNVTLGNLRGAGVLNIDGPGSILNITRRDLSVAGMTRDIDINVTNGGQIDIRGASDTSGWLQLHGQPGREIRLLLDGEGSQIRSTGHSVIGQAGTTTARVTGGAVIHSDNSLIVGANEETRTVMLVANGGQASARGSTYIGLDGSDGSLTLAEGGTLTSGGVVFLAHGSPDSIAVLNIGASADAEAAAAGLVDAPLIGFSEGQASLVFNHTGRAYEFTTTIDSAPSGTHRIEHLAGTTIFAGSGAGFSGTTEVGGGALMIGAAGHLGGTVNVRSQATLGGTGRLGAVNLGDGAVITPGDAAEGSTTEIGTLSLTGDLIIETGATYRVDTDPEDSTRSDLIHTDSEAHLQGGTVYHAGLLGNYRPDTTWTILTAEEGVTGGFDGVISAFAYLDPTLSYDARNVYLNLTRNDTAFCIDGMTANQCATGTAVEVEGADSVLFDAVVGLDEQGAARAFDYLSGEIHGSVRSLLIEESRFIREAVSARMRLAATDPKNMAAQTDETSGRWVRAYGALGRIDGNGNAGRIDRSTAGFLTGFDALIGANGRLGVLAGYSHSSYHLDSRASSAASNNIHLGLYGGAEWDALRLSGGLAYSWHDVSTNRSVRFSNLNEGLSAGYDAHTAQIFGEAAWQINTENTTFEPFAGLARVRVKSNAFEESGENAALSAHSKALDTSFATLGLRAVSQFVLSGQPVTVGGTLGWRHAFGDVEPTATHFLASGTPFSITGIPIARNVAVIEAGLKVDLSSTADFGLSYYGQIGSDSRDHGMNATLNMQF